MQQLVSLREINHHLTQYIHSVEQGNEVIITRRGKPIAMMVPLKKTTHLTPQQQQVRKNLLNLMAKGWLFGILYYGQQQKKMVAR